MIQRIQTLFFLMSAIAFAALYKLPFATSSSSFGETYQNLSLDLEDSSGLLSMAILGAILSLIAIFLFRNRKLQVSLGYLIVIVGLGLTGLAYYLFSTANNSVEASTQLGIGIGLPILASIMAFLGNIFIKKDDRLVNSMNRLR